MTVTIALALSTSLLFGIGDFLGGVATRRDSAFAVTGTSHLISIVLMVIVVSLLPAASPTAADLWFGALSGLLGVLGVLSLYAALAVGRMSIVAPVSAALSAALPAIFDFATGTSLSPITVVGIALALVAIVIVSIAPDDQLHEPVHQYRPRLALGLAILSGIGFSGAFISLSFTAVESGLTPILAARVVSIAVAVVLALRFGSGFPVDRSALKPTIGAGLADVLANVTMLTAIRIGPLAVASVLGSLFPVVVVALARVFLKERLHAWQKFGVALAVAAVLFSAMP
ncbi:MAG: DMT family transporter [Coriobacteriia bacterium]|nr:DMT family transporter [Coriobacteriia bacterium]MBN2839830.1 DMT family transporter [Coriobacteriia bacterium]